MFRIRITELGRIIEVSHRRTHQAAYAYARRYCESWLKLDAPYSATYTGNCCYVYHADQNMTTGTPTVTVTIVDTADDPAI